MGMLVQIARAENSKILLNKTQSQTRRQHRDLILIRDSWHPPGYLTLLFLLYFAQFLFLNKKVWIYTTRIPNHFQYIWIGLSLFWCKIKGWDGQTNQQTYEQNLGIIVLDIFRRLTWASQPNMRIIISIKSKNWKYLHSSVTKPSLFGYNSWPVKY